MIKLLIALILYALHPSTEPERVADKAAKTIQIKQVNRAESVMNKYTLTAYTNHFQSTGKHPWDKGYGITTSGEQTLEGVTIAADWRVLPKGSLVYIEGLGLRIVQDKGGAIKGNRIDVYFEDENEAMEFGVKKNVKVKVMRMGE
jgi:3D (Asp-Asp-Asp) domain-containing protein